MNSSSRWRRRISVTLAVLAGMLVSLAGPARPAAAATYVDIAGSGSTFAANAFREWTRNVQQYGMHVDYAAVGSTTGRTMYRDGTVDFAVSDLPYGLPDAGVSDPPPTRGFAYMPATAGATTFAYNLSIDGQRVTNLRLSGDNIAKIFTRY